MEIIGDDNETNGFTFVWAIHNFTYCVQKTGDCLDSPRFELNNNGFKNCKLELFPRGHENPDGILLCLRRNYNMVHCANVRIGYVFSILTVKGSFKKIIACESLFGPRTSFSNSLSLQKIYQGGTEAYLDNDTLTVKFRMCKLDGTILESEQCHARTIIGVERVIYNWDLEAFGNLKTKKQPNLSEISSFTMDFSMSKGILGEKNFEVIIKRTNANKLYFSTCAISLLDTEKVLQSVRNEHWFERSQSEQVWTVSFTPKSSLLTYPKQNSPISLLCEFAVSLDIESSKVEKTVHGKTMVRPLVRSMDPGTLVPTIDPDIGRSWKDNLLSFYSEGKLSNVTIRTPRKEFPVHKVMLCAQSAVFSAMFEGDMKENRTGIVEIEDLEDDTVSMMLVFVYTGTVENLDWGTASTLYFAADKYEMTVLKEQCSSFIKNNLSASNACECLILADMHSDQDLKSVAQDFVIKHSANIIKSDEWKELMKGKVHLAAETMHLMFMRNQKV